MNDGSKKAANLRLQLQGVEIVFAFWRHRLGSINVKLRPACRVEVLAWQEG